MKPKSGNFVSLAIVFVTLASPASAAEVVRANVAITLNDTTAWVGGVVPGVDDIARWDNTVATGANATAALGADATWDGIKVVNPAAGVVISAGNTLTLDGGAGSTTGIDVTSTQNLTITAPLVLAGNQIWNVGTGRFFTMNGTTGFNQGSSNITKNGFGTVQFIPGALAAAPVGTGTITVNAGLLEIRNGANTINVNLTNAISGTTALVVGGGTMETEAAANVGTFVQVFSSLNLAAGASTFTQARGANSATRSEYATVGRSVGGTLNALPTSNGSGFRLTTGTFPVELVSGGIVQNSADFVRAANATTIWGGVTYEPLSAWVAGNETNVLTSNSQTDATSNAVRFNTAGALTLTLAGTNTITSGGLLVTNTVGANTTTITGGILRGAAGLDLIVHQFNGNAGGSLNIASEIADNTSPTALTKTGPGTLVLAGNNTFTGGVFINQGNIQLANPGALNSTTSNPVTFTNNSNGRLQLAGNSVTVSSLQTSPVISGTIPIVENANAANATLTVVNSAASSFAGTVQDGTGGGKLGLIKSGAGSLTLSGSSTAYTGNTTVSVGTLALAGTAVPGAVNTVSIAGGAFLDVTARTGGSLTIGNAQTLTGSGSVTGGIVTGTGSVIAPGSGGVGTLAATSLTAGSGSAFNFEVSPGSTDLIDVTGTDGLTINSGSGLNLYVPGTTDKLQTNGTYQLFKYTGTIQGAGVAALTTANILNPQGGLFYSFAESGGFIEMTVSGVPAPTSIWSASGSGSWGNTANWNNATVPNLLGATANLNGAIGSASVVTLDGNRQIGALVLNSPLGYTISSGTPATSVLTLNNGSGNSTVDVTNGSHTISAPLELLSSTSITVANLADTLTLSGVVSDDGVNPKGITKFGLGTLDFASAFETPNTFSGGLTIAAGTVQFNALDSLGSDFITIAGGTLKWAAAMPDDVEDISTRVVTIGSGGATFDTNGNDVTLIGAIGNAGVGALAKAGAGTLTLASGNDFTGGAVIKGGTLVISADSALGVPPVSAAIGLTFQPGVGNAATLSFLGATTLAPTRSILLSNGTAQFDTSAGDGTFAGLISGTGRLSKIGTGILTITGVNDVNATGGTTISGGTLFVNNQTNLPAGGVIMNNDAILSVTGGTFHNNYTINGDNAIVCRNNSLTTVGTGLTGTGTLRLASPFVNDYGPGSLENFQGTILLGGGTRINGTAGSANWILDTGAVNHGVSIRTAPFTVAVGALTGISGNLGGSTGNAAGTAVTWNVGGKNLSTTYGGTISNGDGNTNVNKIGTGSLTLTGIGSHTGITNVNVGSLIFSGGSFTASQINVASAAFLTGNGTLAAVNVLIGGNLAPGISGIGTLATKNTNLQGTLQVEVDATSNTADQLAVTGNLNLTGSTLDFSVLNGPLTLPAYVFASYTTINGSGTVTNLPPGYRVDYNYQGLNQLALTTDPLSPFDTWAAGFGLVGGDATGPADPDRDGISNKLEFILNGDPTIGDTSILPTLNTSDPNTLVFTYNRADASESIVQTVEQSTNLSDWTTLPPILIGAGDSSGIGYTVVVAENAGAPDLITVTIQRNGNTSLFARLKAVN